MAAVASPRIEKARSGNNAATRALQSRLTARASAVGSGEAVPEALVPIDVHCDKLVAWLVDRKRLAGDWRPKLAALRSRAASAAASLPPELAAGVPAVDGAPAPDYAACVALRDAAEAAAGGAEARGLFGRRAGAARDWDALAKAYERDALQLPEAAQFLVQATEYEVPLLRKTVQKCHAQRAEAERREADARSAAAAASAAFAAACAEWGVRGASLRSELRAAAAEALPGVWAAAAEALRDDALREGAALYDAFAPYAHAPEAPGPAAPSSVTWQMPLLPLLAKMRAPDGQGASWTELGFSDADASADAAADSAGGGFDLAAAMAGADGGETHHTTEIAAPPDEICWDIDTTAAADEGGAALNSADDGGAPEISWDIDPAALESEQAEQAARLEAAESDGGGGGAIEINWDIDMSAVEASSDEPGAAMSSDAPMVAVANAGDAGMASLPENAAKLATAAVREAVVTELLELRAFLSMRHREMAAEEAAAAPAAAAPDAVARATRAGVAAARDAAARAAAALTSRRTRELLLIHASPRYCDRLAASIEARNGVARKLPATLADVEAARAAARRSLAAATRDLEATQQRMRAAKAMTEAAISAMFANRPVHIVGALANCI